MATLDPRDLAVDFEITPEDSVYLTLDDSITSNMSYSYDITASTSISGPYGTTGMPWTTGTGISANWDNNTAAKITANGRLELSGEDADVVIRGESLVTMLKNIEQRLNILKPNEQLESEWEELRALGEQYRALEQRILDKQATWDRLKAMPPPEID